MHCYAEPDTHLKDFLLVLALCCGLLLPLHLALLAGGALHFCCHLLLLACDKVGGFEAELVICWEGQVGGLGQDLVIG